MSLLLTYLKNLRRSGKCETPRSSKIDVYLLEVKCFHIFVLVTFMPSRNVELQLACLPTLLCGYSDNVWINSCGEEGTAWKNGQGFKFYLGGHKGMDQRLCWLTSRRAHWLGRPICTQISWVQIALWPPAEFDFSGPGFSSRSGFVNSQLVASFQVGFLIHVIAAEWA